MKTAAVKTVSKTARHPEHPGATPLDQEIARSYGEVRRSRRVRRGTAGADWSGMARLLRDLETQLQRLAQVADWSVRREASRCAESGREAQRSAEARGAEVDHAAQG